MTRNWGKSPTWDDLRTPVTATTVAGSHPPTKAIFKNSGGESVSYAVAFDGSTSTAAIPHAASDASEVFDFAAAWSLSFWATIDPDALPNTYLFGNAQWSLRIRPGSNLRLTLDSNGSHDTITGYIANQRTHFVLTLDESGGSVIIKLYLNNTLVIDTSVVGSLAADSNSDIYVGTLNGALGFCHCVIDNVRFWDIALSASDVTSLYADGAGTEDAVQDGNTTSYYKLDEGTGTAAADEKYGGATTHIMTLTNPSWVSGLVESTATTRGVLLDFFSPNLLQELFFCVQMPHTWVELDSIEAHVHWSPEDNTAGSVIWGLEYVWVNIGEIAGNTTSVEVTAAVDQEASKHVLTDIATLEGSDKTSSSMLLGRLYRDGINDTYAGGAWLWEIDFHYRFFDRGDIDV